MRIVVSLSGGLDSAVLAAWLSSTDHEVRCIGVNYGQRHVVELQYAAKVAQALGLPFDVVEVPGLAAALGGSSQTDPNVRVPKGHYADATMRATVVPNRNMILLAIAAGAALAKRFEAVAIANHAGDHAIYPDCRPEFVDAMRPPLSLCHYEPVRLLTPFVDMTKADIVKLGARLQVPFVNCYSCYEGRDGNGHLIHCGECGTCYERAEAFRLAGEPDPTTYVRTNRWLRGVEPLEKFAEPTRLPA